MKKTFNINIAGYPFVIDEDAYLLLKNYLDTISSAFSNQEDSMGIIEDIEARVAELLFEAGAEKGKIITIDDVKKIIQRIGQPDEIIEQSEDIEIEFKGNNNQQKSEINRETVSINPPPFNGNQASTPPPFYKKKLFRDPQNAMLGGVCSGLAHYLNIDPTIMRLITVVLTILSASTCGIAYIILWIVVPEARTPLQRMQMLGEQPTVENIGKTVTDSFSGGRNRNNYNDDNNQQGSGSLIGNFCSIVARIFIIIGLIIAIPLLIVLIIGFIGCLFALIMMCTSLGFSVFGDSIPVWMEGAGNIPLYGVILALSIIIVIALPLYLFVRLAIRPEGSRLTPSTRGALLIIWIVAFLVGGVTTGMIVSDSSKYEKTPYSQQIESIEEVETTNEIDSDIIDEESESDSTEIDETIETVENISTTTLPQ